MRGAAGEGKGEGEPAGHKEHSPLGSSTPTRSTTAKLNLQGPTDLHNHTVLRPGMVGVAERVRGEPRWSEELDERREGGASGQAREKTCMNKGRKDADHHGRHRVYMQWRGRTCIYKGEGRRVRTRERVLKEREGGRACTNMGDRRRV